MLRFSYFSRRLSHLCPNLPRPIDGTRRRLFRRLICVRLPFTLPDKSVSRPSRIVRVCVVIAVAAVAAAVTVRAQNLQTVVSNQFRYGRGDQALDAKTVSKEYLEDLFDTRMYVSDFTLGFRVEIDKPREYGRDTLGLTQYFGEFRRDGLRVRAGSFYNLIGRGMIFNTFESRPLGFNTQTDGVELDFDQQKYSVGAFGGILNYADILNPSRVEQYLVRGASGEVRPIAPVAVGGGYVAATGNPTRSGYFREFNDYLREGHVAVNYDGLSAYLSVSDKRTDIDSATRARTSSSTYGTGYYEMLGYATDIFGITAEYKNYRFDLVNPDERDVNTRATRGLPFQNPPTLVYEHDKTLLARNPHAPDLNDEVGFQLEGLVYPSEDLTLTFIGLGGSRHSAYEATFVAPTDSGEVAKTMYHPLDDAPRAFPELADVRYSPYWEAFAKADYTLDDDNSFSLALQQRYNMTYTVGNGDLIAPSAVAYRASTAMLEAYDGLGKRNTLHSILELQRVTDDTKVQPAIDSIGQAASDGRYFNALLTLEFTRSPTWTIFTRVEYSTTNTEESQRHFWPVIGAAYRIGTAHTITAQYGAERGGVVCTGGVCRLINPFEGFRLEVTSTL